MSRRRQRQRTLAAHFGPHPAGRDLVTFAQYIDAVVDAFATALRPIVAALTAVGEAVRRPVRQDDYTLAPPGDPA